MPKSIPPALRYIGNGAALPNIPARDLAPAEVARFDLEALLASGLYEPVPPAQED